jgi:undecaprenyl phosphate N,N'-diacetylbacillosamine 1-phosphate transferase
MLLIKSTEDLFYRLFFKRVLDVVIATAVFILLFPFFAIITVGLLIFNKGGQPFFRQLRPGKDERIFQLYKFRTMNDNVDENQVLLPDSKRLTSIGKVLRRTSLDELPQLLNVIKGDMSLIGPRPLLPRYLPFYSPKEKLRHQIRPGITGFAQVNGRNTSSWNDRLEADVYYYYNLSLKLDALILYKTVKGVFSAKDIVIDPDSLMDPLDIERSKLPHHEA